MHKTMFWRYVRYRLQITVSKKKLDFNLLLYLNIIVKNL